LLALDSKAQ